MAPKDGLVQEIRPEAITKIHPVSLLATRQIGQFKLNFRLNIADLAFAFLGNGPLRQASGDATYPAPLSIHILSLDFKGPPSFFAVNGKGKDGLLRQKVGSVASPIKGRGDFIAEPGAVGPAAANSFALFDVIGKCPTVWFDLDLIGQFRRIPGPRLADLFDFGI